MSGLAWMKAHKEEVAEIVLGMADAIEKRFVFKDTSLTGKEVATVIVVTMREMAEDVRK